MRMIKNMNALLKKLKEPGFRNKAVISLLALAILAGAFIFVYAYYVPQRRAEKLYTEAERAVQKGDLKSAELRLKELLKEQPGHPKAKSELAKVETAIKQLAQAAGGSSIIGGGSTGQPPGSSGSGASQPGGGESGGLPGTGGAPGGGKPGGSDQIPNPSFESVLPQSIASYTQINRTTSPMEESRAYKPDRDGSVKLMTVVARNEGDGDNAQKYIDTTLRRHYSEGAKDVLVRQKSAYFGTDNSALAILTYRVAGMVVAVEMQASGVKPEALYDQLMAVANQFP
ncbi:MAG: hypothetical protein M1548_10320 [Actinobacteria bacterium]|nr:hypothetical protein [Actinomycetota bacterium]